LGPGYFAKVQIIAQIPLQIRVLDTAVMLFSQAGVKQQPNNQYTIYLYHNI
jgi:hypothetical protein